MSLLQSIPKVDRVLVTEPVQELLQFHSRPFVLAAVRSALDELRQRIRSGEPFPPGSLEQTVAARAAMICSDLSSPNLKRVVNGTGIVIHTNLGRSLLAEAARQGLADAAFRYTNLELDLATGERGSRYSHVEQLLCELTGAEAALVVNNNAAAVLLALASLAAGREVVVSRGELVEIGGSFRIPEVMAQSGAVLREVGTTNRTHRRDYQNAIASETALFLKVHTSNYAVVGFTATVEADDLVDLGRRHGVPVMADLGSGSLVNLSSLLGCDEPTVGELVRQGVDVVTFSGDKLLGGPQAGIIVGSRERLDLMKRHPLLRALRIDKLTLAALEATLRLYRDQRQALAEIPTLRLLATPSAVLAERGKRVVRRLRRQVSREVVLTLEEGVSQVGGGALPLLELPTTLLAVEASPLSAREVEAFLRGARVPIIGRIQRGKFLLDLRTILDDDVAPLMTGLSALAVRASSSAT
ncbi:L-seryl-tRNA(Sec) selenium transferase [Geobacter sp. DSM 9736]|uniref:L-seryl-tRNA(Sec) selenium transferase n=1 Tax=Geobacter sp. DSM 9736 TaxID=1277350 RepID=UPI000B511C43|nr:L-seryl-tRNA(Sec) selenium transferase [Geobacter sp. DSM 9736]SNB47677.1 L-seryl-tRNA(Sec) selenium transferase [Geobacter sp. DSM 9736]